MEYDFLLKVPSINKRAVCISDNQNLTAIISSYFNKRDEYFCVLEAPRIKRPDWENEIIRKNNIVALLRPEKVILATSENNLINKLQQYLPSHRLVIINSENEIEEKLAAIGITKPKDTLSCRSSELVYGVLHAKIFQKKLVIDDQADSLEGITLNDFSDGKHTVVLDDITEMSPIITANYTFSINASLKIFPAVDEEKISTSYNDIANVAYFADETRGENAKRSILSQQLTYDSYFQEKNINAKFITFVTRGIPYGYFYPEIPTTHIFSYPDLGRNIFNNIYYYNNITATRNSLLLDPGFFSYSEMPKVINKLMEMGIHVKSLTGNEAKVFNTKQYLENYPYDLLFICSHAGPMEGDLVTANFYDKKNKKHQIVIEEALGFGLTGEGTGMKSMVEALHFMKFIEIDGVDWNDSEGRKKLGVSVIVEDFMSISRDKWEIISSVPLKRGIRECPAIKMTDNFLIPMYHTIAAAENPIIFNNACVSFQKMAQRFIFAGARAYIGTLDTVNTMAAQHVAEEVFSSLSKNKPLPVILWEAQRKIYKEPIERVYLHAGCHFINIVKPKFNTSTYLKEKIKQALGRLLKTYFNNPLSEDVQKNIGQAIKFLGKIDRIIN